MGDSPKAEMTREMKIVTIARVCHEANRTWCQEHGDTSQSPWFGAGQWQRESALKGVEFALGGGGPEAQHQAWCDDKVADGWRYGEVKDAEAKTHPCLVAYDQLPEEQRAKDMLFLSIVTALAPALRLPMRRRYFAGAEPRMEISEEHVAEAERPVSRAAGERCSDPRCMLCRPLPIGGSQVPPLGGTT